MTHEEGLVWAEQEGVRELVVTVTPKTEFQRLVAVLEKQLTLDPDIFGPRGCSPCFSGIERVVLDSRIFERLR